MSYQELSSVGLHLFSIHEEDDDTLFIQILVLP